MINLENSVHGRRCNDYWVKQFLVYLARDSVLLAYSNSCGSFSVSSLAWFMSMQESSFVTLGQRVLARPLK